MAGAGRRGREPEGETEEERYSVPSCPAARQLLYQTVLVLYRAAAGTPQAKHGGQTQHASSRQAQRAKRSKQARTGRKQIIQSVLNNPKSSTVQ